MIKGLDDDEIEFLDLVDRTKLEADRKKELEEEIELKDYRNRVAILQEKSIEERLQSEKTVNKPRMSLSHKNSQQKLLKGVVIKKNENQKRKLSEREDNDLIDENSAKHIKEHTAAEISKTLKLFYKRQTFKCALNYLYSFLYFNGYLTLFIVIMYHWSLYFHLTNFWSLFNHSFI